MSEALRELDEVIRAAKPALVDGSDVAVGELSVATTPAGIIELLTFLRDNAACQFTTLVDICGVDYPAREKRFEVVYHLLSMRQNHRIRVRLAVNEDEMVPSCVDLFPPPTGSSGRSSTCTA